MLLYIIIVVKSELDKAKCVNFNVYWLCGQKISGITMQMGIVSNFAYNYISDTLQSASWHCVNTWWEEGRAEKKEGGKEGRKKERKKEKRSVKLIGVGRIYVFW